jgi:hypothetical protein
MIYIKNFTCKIKIDGGLINIDKCYVQYVVRISKKSNHKTLLYVRINEMALAAKMNTQFKDLYGPGSNREIEEQGKFLKCIQEIVVSPKFYQNSRRSENAIKECPLLL